MGKIKLKPHDQSIIDCLEKALVQNQIPESEFGLCGFGDDRVCIEKKMGIWVVYFGYRGRKTNVKRFLDVVMASDNLLNRFGDSPDERAKLIQDFKMNISHMKKHNSSATVVMNPQSEQLKENFAKAAYLHQARINAYNRTLYSRRSRIAKIHKKKEPSQLEDVFSVYDK